LDTPPILLLSDALVLVPYVDAAIMVTNTDKSSKRSIRMLEESLAQNNLSHISFVLNNIRMKRWQYYFSKYAYKYGFEYTFGYVYGYGGYGYGYGDKPEKSDKTRKGKA
jgi:Mrp family chromosome partitioning ATPase